jgi:hypothetical protein
MARLVRHRQPKGPETDMPSLKPPRHISTLQGRSLVRSGSEEHAMRGRSLVDGRTVQANLNRYWMMNSSYSTVFGLGANSTVRR